jgi:hypothetical protein
MIKVFRLLIVLGLAGGTLAMFITDWQGKLSQSTHRSSHDLSDCDVSICENDMAG